MGRLDEIKKNSTEEKASKEDKLRILDLLIGGDILPTPEIDDIFEVRILEDVKVAKSGNAFLPLVVRPIITNENRENMKDTYNIEENHDPYKLFIPRNGMKHVKDYIKNINANLKNSIFVLKGVEWFPNSDNIKIERDLQGRAKGVSIIEVKPYDDKGQSKLEETDR